MQPVGRRMVRLIVELVELHADVLDLELGILEHGLRVLAQLLVLFHKALTERMQHVLGARLYLDLDLKLSVEGLEPLLMRCEPHGLRIRLTRVSMSIPIAESVAIRVVKRIVHCRTVFSTWASTAVATVAVAFWRVVVCETKRQIIKS